MKPATATRQPARSCQENMFGAYNIFCGLSDRAVACPGSSDFSGEHSLVIGTDYGHLDPSSDTNAILAFQQLAEISEETKERILYHNPKALYNL